MLLVKDSSVLFQVRCPQVGLVGVCGRMMWSGHYILRLLTVYMAVWCV